MLEALQELSAAPGSASASSSTATIVDQTPKKRPKAALPSIDGPDNATDATDETEVDASVHTDSESDREPPASKPGKVALA